MSSGTTATTVFPLPTWLDIKHFLGAGEWSQETGDLGVRASAVLTRHQAADLCARLRGMGLDGHPLTVTCTPPLKRALIRAARTDDARRRRDTSPGFTRKGVRINKEGRIGLTPETLAMQIAESTRGKRVLDACCGIGGNTIGFARAGANVIANERSTEILAMARHNARVYGVTESISFRQGDANQLTTQGCDICFLDPPWGTDWNRVETTPNAFPLVETFYKAFLEGAPWKSLWLKVPASFKPPEKWSSVSPIFGCKPGDARRIKFLLVKYQHQD